MRLTRSRAGALMLIGVVMAGCGGPGGTVKVDEDDYAKASNETDALVKSAVDVVADKVGGDDQLIGDVRPDRCGEAYADHFRRFEVNTSLLHPGSLTREQVVESIGAGLESGGWKKQEAENGTDVFEHGITGGATLTLSLIVGPDAEDPSLTDVGLRVTGTCMELPKDVAEKL